MDLATGGETGVLFGIANGADIKLLGATNESNTGGSLILVKNNSDIHAVADLRGRRIALPYYTAQHYQLAKALDQAGLAWSDADIVNLNTTDGLSALNTGAVDAFVIWDPNSAVAELQYDASPVVNLSSVLKTYGAYYASAQAVADPGKRAALEDLTRRIVRANRGSTTTRPTGPARWHSSRICRPKPLGAPRIGRTRSLPQSTRPSMARGRTKSTSSAAKLTHG